MKLSLVFLSLLFSSSMAFAGIMIEPYLGYESSTTKITAPSSTPTDLGGTATGAAFGARLGYKLPAMVWFAVDYQSSSGKYTFDNALIKAAFGEQDISHNSLGLAVGVDIPMGLRVWGAYNFSDTTKVKSTGVDYKFSGGTSYKAGLGFKVIPLVSINLEYWMAEYKKYDLGGGTGAQDIEATGFFSEVKPSGIILSVSAPFNL